MQQNELKKKLTSRHIFFIALGSAIGTGLFYGSAKAIEFAGPSVLLAYLIGGIAVFMVMRALGEMILHKPISDSFAGYASRYLHPIFGYTTGWMYVLEMILVCIADVVAFSIYMSLWYPNVDPWIWSLLITIVIGAINLFSVKIFAEVEFFLTLLKILAIVSMIAGGVFLLFGNFEGFPESSITNLWEVGGVMPNGVLGFIISFSVVMFAFGGIEIVGITAGETKDPDKNIPRAINSVPARILLFYVLVLGIIISLEPWNKIDSQSSPFVSVYKNLGIEYAAHIVNVILIIAAISAINSDVYGAVRMMYGLSQQRQGPKIFSYLTKKSAVPLFSIGVMIACLLAGVVLNYYFHKHLFFIIAAGATFVTVWVWLMILFSQFVMRMKLSKEEASNLKFKMPFWPVTPILTIAFMFFVIGVIGYLDDTRPALIFGIIYVFLLFISYYAFYKRYNKNDDLSSTEEKQGNMNSEKIMEPIEDSINL